MDDRTGRKLPYTVTVEKVGSMVFMGIEVWEQLKATLDSKGINVRESLVRKKRGKSDGR